MKKNKPSVIAVAVRGALLERKIQDADRIVEDILAALRLVDKKRRERRRHAADLRMAILANDPAEISRQRRYRLAEFKRYRLMLREIEAGRQREEAEHAAYLARRAAREAEDSAQRKLRGEISTQIIRHASEI
jgi:hypothetical protein